VHRCAAGKVIAAHNVAPAIGVPSPAGDGIVNDGGPAEGEDHGRQKTAAFGGGANGECDRDGGEHALVDGKHQIWNAAGADGRRAQDISEANVLEVADEATGAAGEDERIAPEEPLEGDEGGGDDGQPDEGQCGLAAREAGVKESVEREYLLVGLRKGEIVAIPYAGNHEKNKCRRCDHPSNVASIVVDVEVLGGRVASCARLGALRTCEYVCDRLLGPSALTL
jgi:hypothetical protein